MFSYRESRDCLLGINFCDTYAMWFERCLWAFTLTEHTFGFCVLFLFCFELMFCASPVLLNLTVIKCRLGLIEWLLWPSFAQPVLFVLSFVDWNVFYCCVLTAQTWLDLTCDGKPLNTHAKYFIDRGLEVVQSNIFRSQTANSVQLAAHYRGLGCCPASRLLARNAVVACRNAGFPNTTNEAA